MGNGRWSENGSEKGSGSEMGRNSGVRIVGAILVLLLSAGALVGSGSHRRALKAAAEKTASPMPVSMKITQPAKPDAHAILGQMPLIFEPNQGQANAGVKFVSRGAGYSLALDETGATLGLRTARKSNTDGGQFVRMKLVGANPAAATTGTNLLPGKSNYLIGNDPKKWHSGIPQFAGVQYKSIYPGIDLVFYGNQGQLEYDFRAAPGADVSRVGLQFDGASKLQLDGGDLILTGREDGGLRLHAPQIYQPEGDHRKRVAGRFVLRADNRVGFEIGSYDHSRELVIDPLLSFSTYFGGGGSETSPSIALNGDGTIYLAGSTTSAGAGFPGAAVPTTIGSAANIFVAKITPTQPPVVDYLTFLGGSGTDSSVGLGVDNGGTVYVVGNTTSPDFPHSTSPYQTAPEAKGSQCASITCTSVFVTSLIPTGASLAYSSYLSGNGNDQANGMAIDSNQDVFVVGNTTSDNEAISDEFPATQIPAPFEATPLASIQFFVTKVDTARPSNSSIVYSTYFGGITPTGAVAVGGGIAADANGNIYFSGTTNFYNSGSGAYGDSGSGDFPILNAYQPCLDTVPPTILSNPNACSPPTTTPYPTDAFVAKLNPNVPAGSQLLFSTYLGGSGADTSTSLAIDSGAAYIYLTGSTASSGLTIPTGSAAFQTCLNDPGVLVCPTTSTSNTDAYVAKFSNPAASTTGTPVDVALSYFSYLGGGGNDSGQAIAVQDTSSSTLGDVVLTGTTNSGTANPPAFPVTSGPIQSALAGTQNAFFAQINTTTTSGLNGLGAYVTYYGGNGVDRGTSIAVDPVSQSTYFAGDTTSTNFPPVNALQTTLNGPSDAFVVGLASAPGICIANCPAPVVSPSGVVPAGTQVKVTFSVLNQGPDAATGITVTGGVNSTAVTFVSASAGSGSCSTPVSNAVSCTIPSLQVGSISTVTFTLVPTSVGSFEAIASVLEVNNTNTNIVATAPFTSSAYTVSVSPSGQTVAAGNIASYGVTLSATNEFGSSVALTCGSLPPSATCNFANSSLNLKNGNSSTTLFLQTTPQPITTVASAQWGRSIYAFWLMIPGMALLGVGAGGKKRRNRFIAWLALSMLFGLVLLQPSCSSSKQTPPPASGTPSGTYSLTVTATSGLFTVSAPFQLTVNP